jgi:hypothetical protein
VLTNLVDTSPEAYRPTYFKGLVLCGLALSGERQTAEAFLNDAYETLALARSRFGVKSLLDRFHTLLLLLSPLDSHGVLDPHLALLTAEATPGPSSPS